MAETYEGIMNNTFKFIGKKGVKVTLKEVVKYHIDEEGNLVEDFRRVTDTFN
jgi:hypothetical protein